eukprot:652568-Rhodomonas_salina.1
MQMLAIFGKRSWSTNHAATAHISAHEIEDPMLEGESSASPAPGVGHVSILEDLVDASQQGARKVRRHLVIFVSERGV